MGKLPKCNEMRHVRGPRAALTSTTIAMANNDDDYDKLTKEEKEARDKADREREQAEQAGT